MNLDTNFK